MLSRVAPNAHHPSLVGSQAQGKDGPASIGQGIKPSSRQQRSSAVSKHARSLSRKPLSVDVTEARAGHGAGHSASTHQLRQLLGVATPTGNVALSDRKRAVGLVELLLSRCEVVQAESSAGDSEPVALLQLDADLRAALQRVLQEVEQHEQAEQRWNAALRARAAAGEDGDGHASVQSDAAASTLHGAATPERTESDESCTSITESRASFQQQQSSGDGVGSSAVLPPPRTGQATELRVRTRAPSGIDAESIDGPSSVLGDADEAAAWGALTALAVASGTGQGDIHLGMGIDLGLHVGAGLNLTGPGAIGLGTGFDQNEVALHRTHVPDEVDLLPVDECVSEPGTPPGMEDPLVELPPKMWADVHDYIAKPDGHFQRASRRRQREAYAQHALRHSGAGKAVQRAQSGSSAPLTPTSGSAYNSRAPVLPPGAAKAKPRKVGPGVAAYFRTANARDEGTDTRLAQRSMDLLARTARDVPPSQSRKERGMVRRAARQARQVAVGDQVAGDSDDGSSDEERRGVDTAAADLEDALAVSGGGDMNRGVQLLLHEIARVTGTPASAALQRHLAELANPQVKDTAGPSEDAAGKPPPLRQGDMSALPALRARAAGRRRARQAQGEETVAASETQLAHRLARRLMHRAKMSASVAARSAQDAAKTAEAEALKVHCAMYPIGGGGGAGAVQQALTRTALQEAAAASRRRMQGSEAAAGDASPTKPRPKGSRRRALPDRDPDLRRRWAHLRRSARRPQEAHGMSTAPGSGGAGRPGHPRPSSYMFASQPRDRVPVAGAWATHITLPAVSVHRIIQLVQQYRLDDADDAEALDTDGLALPEEGADSASLSPRATPRAGGQASPRGVSDGELVLETGGELGKGVVLVSPRAGAPSSAPWRAGGTGRLSPRDRRGSPRAGSEQSASPRPKPLPGKLDLRLATPQDGRVKARIQAAEETARKALLDAGDTGSTSPRHGHRRSSSQPLADALEMLKATEGDAALAEQAAAALSKNEAELKAKVRAGAAELPLGSAEETASARKAFEAMVGTTIRDRVEHVGSDGLPVETGSDDASEAGSVSAASGVAPSAWGEWRTGRRQTAITPLAHRSPQHSRRQRPSSAASSASSVDGRQLPDPAAMTESALSLARTEAVAELQVGVPLWSTDVHLRHTLTEAVQGHRHAKHTKASQPAGEQAPPNQPPCLSETLAAATSRTELPPRPASTNVAHFTQELQAKPQDVLALTHTVKHSMPAHAGVSPFVVAAGSANSQRAPERKLRPARTRRKDAQGALPVSVVPTPVDARIGSVWTGTEGSVKRILNAQRVHDALEGRTGPPVVPHSAAVVAEAKNASEGSDDDLAVDVGGDGEALGMAPTRQQATSPRPRLDRKECHGDLAQEDASQAFAPPTDPSRGATEKRLNAEALQKCGGVRGAGPRRGGRSGSPLPLEEQTAAPRAVQWGSGTATSPALLEQHASHPERVFGSPSVTPGHTVLSRLLPRPIGATSVLRRVRTGGSTTTPKRAAAGTSPARTPNSTAAPSSLSTPFTLSPSPERQPGPAPPTAPRLVFRAPSFREAQHGRSPASQGAEGDDVSFHSSEEGKAPRDVSGGSQASSGSPSTLPGSPVARGSPGLNVGKFRKLLAMQGAVARLSSVVGRKNARSKRNSLLRVAQLANAQQNLAVSAAAGGDDTLTAADVQRAAEQLAAAEVAGALSVAGHMVDPIVGPKVSVMVSEVNDASAVVARMPWSEVGTDALRAPRTALQALTEEDIAEGRVDRAADFDPFGARGTLGLPSTDTGLDYGEYSAERREWSTALHARATSAVQKALYKAQPWWHRAEPGEEAATLADEPPAQQVGSAPSPAAEANRPAPPQPSVGPPSSKDGSFDEDLAGLNLEGMGETLALSASAVASGLVARLRHREKRPSAVSWATRTSAASDGEAGGKSRAPVEEGGENSFKIKHERDIRPSVASLTVRRGQRGAAQKGQGVSAVPRQVEPSVSMVALASVPSVAQSLGGADDDVASVSSHLAHVTGTAGGEVAVGARSVGQQGRNSQGDSDVQLSLEQKIQLHGAAALRAGQTAEFQPRHTHRRAEAMPRCFADAVQFRLTGVKAHTQEGAKKVRKAAQSAVRKYQRRELSKLKSAHEHHQREVAIRSAAMSAVNDVMSDIALSRRRHVHRAAFGVQDRPPTMKDSE